MARRIHSMALVGLGFAAGAAAMALVGALPYPPRPAGPEAAPSAGPQAPRQSYADAVAAAAPAVVNVYGRVGSAPPATPSAYGMRPVPREPHAGTSLGSGVVVSGDGLIVTNAHIVKDAAVVHIELPDGRMLDASLAGIDRETDLAVLQAALPRGGGPLVPIRLGDPGALAVGDVVLAIGNPFGLGQTVSLGIVSATGRTHLGLTDIENFIQTDAAINPGNSGGALVDDSGRLLGINTAILSASGRSEGVGFAIPVDLVMGVVDQLARRGEVRRGWIGIGGRSLTPQLAERYGLRAPHGVLVSSVAEASPAAAAGIRPGDVITGAGEETLHSSLALRDLITGTAPGSRLRVRLWRGSQQLETTIATAARPPGGVATRTSSERRPSREARLRPGAHTCTAARGSSC